MATQPVSPQPRAPLSRDRVLHAAVELADRDGIEGLSMRKLGQELGVEAMSLYNHVRNKDDLHDGIVEIVLGEVENPSPDGDWKEEMRRTAISAHEVFIRHRWACSLMMRVPRVSPVRMEWMESLLRTLREAGFSADMTHHAYHALDSHITGFTLWQVSMPSRRGRSSSTWPRASCSRSRPRPTPTSSSTPTSTSSRPARPARPSSNSASS